MINQGQCECLIPPIGLFSFSVFRLSFTILNRTGKYKNHVLFYTVFNFKYSHGLQFIQSLLIIAVSASFSSIATKLYYSSYMSDSLIHPFADKVEIKDSRV